MAIAITVLKNYYGVKQLPENKIILLLAANPKDTVSLCLQEEEREIRERLRIAGYGKIPIYSTSTTRTRDIQQAMLDFNPQVVHFCGHGTGQAGLVFEDITGQEKLVSSEALAGLFRLFADQVECVILNACSSEVQAQAISQYIDYVIGMNQSIGDKAAIEFAVGFYAALGAGRSYEFAYAIGCNAIQLAGIQENLTPILLKKSTVEEKSNLLIQAQSLNKPENPSIPSVPGRSGEELRNQIAQKSIEVNSLKNKFRFELDKQILDAEMQGFLSAFQQQNDVSSIFLS
ncbi:MAG: CHAT domain-containing protein [Brasilonema sp.]